MIQFEKDHWRLRIGCGASKRGPSEERKVAHAEQEAVVVGGDESLREATALASSSRANHSG